MRVEILIVEDDLDIAENLKDLLEIEGYLVVIAREGQEALQYLRGCESKPGVILLDLMMPVMDGFEFRRQQSLDPTLSQIPVIIMTAGGNNVEAKVKPLHVADYFRKPLDIDSLISSIQRVTGQLQAAE